MLGLTNSALELASGMRTLAERRQACRTCGGRAIPASETSHLVWKRRPVCFRPLHNVPGDSSARGSVERSQIMSARPATKVVPHYPADDESVLVIVTPHMPAVRDSESAGFAYS